MNHLVIMAKQPIAGRVKSRLASSIGAIAATRAYRNLMTSTMRALSLDRRWKTWAAVAPDSAVVDYNWPAGVIPFGQGAGDLGVRMQRIFDSVPPGPIIIIGTDIPFIKGNDIADAFRQLGANDLVFGKTGDGGFWLVGVKRSPRVENIFNRVRWSSEHALSDTLANAEHLKTGYAASHFDVDTKADFLRWRGLQV